MASDPLAAEHAALNRWVQEAIESVGAGQYWKDVELKSLPSGRILLEAPPEQARSPHTKALAPNRERGPDLFKSSYTLKELPQPQVDFTFGLLNLKPDPSRPRKPLIYVARPGVAGHLPSRQARQGRAACEWSR